MAGQRALVVVDVQRGFEDPAFGPRDNPAAEENIAKLDAIPVKNGAMTTASWWRYPNRREAAPSFPRFAIYIGISCWMTGSTAIPR